jgi:8-oxo-dGTP diphosphatase
LTQQVSVVGAVITHEGLILCAQRGQTGTLPGLWEFPGGKIETGETMQEALKREIDEELGCVVEVGSEITSTIHEYEFATVTLTTFYCRILQGTPLANEHMSLQWLHPLALNELQWAPADVPTVAKIRLNLI